MPNPYLDYLIDRSFQGLNRIFVLSFENNTDRTVHTKYFLQTVEIKDYNWNKYQSKSTIHVPNPYLDYLIDANFQGLNRIFVLSFKHNTERTVHTKYYLETVEIEDYDVMTDGGNVFDKPVKNNLKIHDKNRKFTTGQRVDYTTAFLSDYNYFNIYHKMIAIDLNKQQALHDDPKAIQQINFTENLARNSNANTAMFVITEEVKKTKLDFSNETVQEL